MAKTIALSRKLVGKAVAFVSQFGVWTDQLERDDGPGEGRGGQVVDGETTAPDYLVEGEGARKKPPAATAKVKKKFPAVQVLDQAGFYQLVAPTPDDLMAILAAGPHPHEYWNTFRERVEAAKVPLDLSGRDFRRIDLTGTDLFAKVDGGDFRGGQLAGARFFEVRGARFDGADMRDCDFITAHDCSLKNVNLDDGRFNPSEFTNCDFGGAVLTNVLGSNSRATDCNFSKVQTTGSSFEECEFKGCDFTKADLSGTRLEKTDFTDATLTGADLSKADARGVKFVNADLRKARFRDAVLTGADFTGAKIDGADFTGANLTAVIAGGLDPSKAKNFQLRAVRTAGPKMIEFETAAIGSKKFKTTIELDLGPGEYVVLEPEVRQFSGAPHLDIRYSHTAPNGGIGSYVKAATFAQGMLDLADLWDRGTPKFDTVQVEAKGCSLKSAALRDLAVAAWYEAFGRAAPTAAEFAAVEASAAAEKAGLRRAAGRADGRAGRGEEVERPDRQGADRVGSLKGLDFTGPIAGANLSYQDVRKGRFGQADLTKANFGRADLTGAVFDGGDMTGAAVAGGRANDASFADVRAVGANLAARDFRRASFARADLTGANFQYSDLRGADLETATLDGVVFLEAKIDSTTRFPAGFVSDEDS